MSSELLGRHDLSPNPVRATQAVVIHNRVAGRALKRDSAFQSAVSILVEHGWAVDVRTTSSEGHAARLARAAAESGADIVVAAGGDGTINEVIQGLVHTTTALGCLPLGTVNVWSKEVGYSRNVCKAACQLVHGHRVQLDVGRVGERYFLLMAGVGLDAEVTATLGAGKAHKQRFGFLPYILRTAQVMPHYRGASVEINMDGASKTHDALMVLVSNTRLYGGVARPIPDALANDGMLDVRVFHGNHLLDSVQHVIPFLFGAGSRSSGDIVRTPRLTVTATPPLAVQVDGDHIGTTPIEIEVEPEALTVVVPKTFNRSLLRETDV